MAEHILMGVLTLAVLFDISTAKIPNMITLFGMAAGLLLSLLPGSGISFLSAIGGMALPLVLFPLFRLRMIGAGDIKLMMAVGALIGVEKMPHYALAALIAAGVLSLMLISDGAGEGRLSYLTAYFAEGRYRQSGRQRRYIQGRETAALHGSVPLYMAGVLVVAGLVR